MATQHSSSIEGKRVPVRIVISGYEIDQGNFKINCGSMIRLDDGSYRDGPSPSTEMTLTESEMSVLMPLIGQAVDRNWLEQQE